MDEQPTGIIQELIEQIRENRLYKIIAILFAVSLIIIIVGIVKSNLKSLKAPAPTTEVTTEENTSDDSSKNTTESVGTEEQTTEPATEPKLTASEAETIAQTVFNKAYNVLKGDAGFANWDYSGKIKYDGVDVNAYSVNMDSLKPYFTEKCLKFIGSRFTDTPDADKAVDVYGNKGSYYIFADGNSHASSFSNTIFGMKDHEKAELAVLFADDDMILAKNNMYYYGIYESEDTIERVEYIILVKEDDEWKIDMFEDFSSTVNTLDKAEQTTNSAD